MATIKIEDLKSEQRLVGKELEMIKGGVIGDCGMPRFGSLHTALPGDPMPGLSRGLVAVSPITIPRPIRGLMGQLIEATPITLP